MIIFYNIMENGFIDPLLLVISFLPILFIGLFIVIYSFPDYSIENDISLAGTKNSPRRNVFITLFTLYGLSIVYVGFRLYLDSQDDNFINLLSLAMVFNGVVTMLVGLIPKDKKKLLHNVVSYAAFIILSINYLLGLIYFINNYFVPIIMINIINLTVLFALGWRTVIQDKFDKLTWRIEWLSLFLSIIYLFLIAIYFYFF